MGHVIFLIFLISFVRTFVLLWRVRRSLPFSQSHLRFILYLKQVLYTYNTTALPKNKRGITSLQALSREWDLSINE